MAYRDHWKFEYTISLLTDAAAYKTNYHEGRLKAWREKRDETMAKIRSEGLEIKESAMANTTNYSVYNSGHGAQVYVRVDLQQDLNECEQKIAEHRNKVADYKAWNAVFAAQDGQKQLELSKDDWLYFFYGMATE